MAQVGWDILTAPLYEPAEAGRIVGMASERVRRWLLGYSYSYKVRGTTKRGHQRPVVQRTDTADPYASFLDLIELRFAQKFMSYGLTPQRVRAAFKEAAEITGEDHPFARRKFFTDGRTLYLDLKKHQSDAPNLLQLLSGGQWVISEIVLQYAEEVDFDEQSRAVARWWPMGKEEPVVIDPALSFGKSTIEHRGLKTSNVYSFYLGERKNVAAVARWFDLRHDEVEAAVRWEQQLRTAA